MNNRIKTILLLVLSLSSLILSGQTIVGSNELKEDLNILWQALNELHPGLYRHTTAEELAGSKNNLEELFSSSMDEKNVFLELSKFTAEIQCGHTYLNPFNQRNPIIEKVLSEAVLLPFTFSILEKKLIVHKPFTDEVTQFEVISDINGIPSSQVIESLASYIKADGNRLKKRIKDLEVTCTSKYEYFDYYFPMIFGFRDEVLVGFQDGSKRMISLINKEQRAKMIVDKYPELASDNYDNLWGFEILENHAYLKLGTFVTWRLTFDWEEYLDDFFDKLSRENTANLIIDVRGNEGGETEVANYLIRKLAKREGELVFRRPHLSYKKVSDAVRPHVSTWSKRFYNNSIWTKKLNKEYRTIKFSAKRPKKVKESKDAYRGRTILLVNESNSSATFILAEGCKENGFATLVGTETGGTKKGITGGQIFFLTLPNSKIEIDIPLIGMYPMEDMPDEGIRPDYVVEQSSSGLSQGIDDQLEKALSLIEKQASFNSELPY